MVCGRRGGRQTRDPALCRTVVLQVFGWRFYAVMCLKAGFLRWFKGLEPLHPSSQPCCIVLFFVLCVFLPCCEQRHHLSREGREGVMCFLFL